ncbi:hypothetical protein KAZ93_02180, partial [Patescibacteria group bacterium]|nr:hypothetical protein [Patescibacteria group bacterium]
SRIVSVPGISHYKSLRKFYKSIGLITFHFKFIIMLFVSGSIAYDTIISTVGTFGSNVRGTDSPYNLSLYAPRVRVASGGTGHNIAYNLGLLGLKEQTVLAGSV